MKCWIPVFIMLLQMKIYAQDPFVFNVEWVSETGQRKTNGVWRNVSRTLTIFNNDNRAVRQVVQVFSAAADTFLNKNIFDYFYSISDRPDSTRCLRVDENEPAWDTNSVHIYNWKPNRLEVVMEYSNTRDTHIMMFDSLGRTCEDSMFIEYRETGDVVLISYYLTTFEGTVGTTEFHEFDTKKNTWYLGHLQVDSTLEDFTGKDSVLYHALYDRNFATSAWELFRRMKYEYHYTNGQLTSRLGYSFDTTDNSWNLSHRDLYEYPSESATLPVPQSIRSDGVKNSNPLYRTSLTIRNNHSGNVRHTRFDLSGKRISGRPRIRAGSRLLIEAIPGR